MRACRIFAALVWAAVILASVPSRPSAAPSDVLPFQATEKVLANGLHVIVVPTGFPNLVSIEIPVQVGSRNEIEPGRSGFAHFFEHLMFRGTPSTPPEQYQAIMAKAGARDNAATGNNRTHFFATFAKEHVEQVIALYADMFQHLSYSEDDFKTEARAILGEYNRSSADPVNKLFEVLRDHFYQLHPYKHTTMGFINDIENMPNEYQYSKLFFERWYRPQYTTLIVAGDVTADQVLPMVEKYWGSWKSGTAPLIGIPKEPPPQGPRYAYVPWSSDTLPYLVVAFPSPAFSEVSKESAAMEMIAALYFGPTSELYKRLVVTEQKVDVLFADAPPDDDPSLFTVLARVKQAADAVYVRDQILATFVAARASRVPDQELINAKAHNRYAFARSLGSTERIAGVVSGYAAHRRAYDTVNNRYRTLDSLDQTDLEAAAKTYFTDAGLIVTALSKEPLAPEMERLPALGSLKPAQTTEVSSAPPSPPVLPAKTSPAVNSSVRVILQRSLLPELDIKLLFAVGSAHDPVGKEGLAALTAAMITKAGSKEMTIDQINAVLYPMAGSFAVNVDREMTAFTATIHRDRSEAFITTALPQLLEPGFREDDFRRLKVAQLNALVQDLRSNNDEELGKERLQTNIFRGTAYGHVALGTVAGINQITLDDVKQFAATLYTRANLTLGVSGDASDELVRTVQVSLAKLPQGPAASRVRVGGVRPSGLEVEIIEKDTRATAISFGFPIDVIRGHPDFPALWLARSWLGEHRIQSGQLFQRIREIRGINYGDYAYIEAFPRGMSRFFPDPNIARQKQLFEIWIRPVVPVNALMTLRIAIHELDKLIQNGLTQDDFTRTRDYLLNNVYVMTAEQDQQLGYALDSQWYGTGEFTAFMRKALSGLTVGQVNAAIKKHLTARDMSIVYVTKDAVGLKQALVADTFSPIRYDGDKSPDLLAEDQIIGSMKLHIAPERVTITPVAEVFAR